MGGERKTITITFSDIVGFTQIAEQLPPEELMLHLSEYLNGVTEIIHANKGNVDKYIGDAVMSFWGAPLDSFHPQNACYAMLSVMSWLKDKNKQWATPINQFSKRDLRSIRVRLLLVTWDHLTID